MMQRLFKVLSSEIRLKILKNLLESEEPQCYCELVEELGKDRSVIYRHFKKLEEAGLIETRKEGKRLEGNVRKPKTIRKMLELAEKVNKDGD